MMWCSECGRGEGGERAGGEGEERGGWGERGEGRVRRGECVGRGESGERRGWGERERRVGRGEGGESGRGEGGDEYMCMCDHSPSISTSLTPPLIHPTPHSPHPSLIPPLINPTPHSPHPSFTPPLPCLQLGSVHVVPSLHQASAGDYPCPPLLPRHNAY